MLLFSYDETVAEKEPDDLKTIFAYYIQSCVLKDVQELKIFFLQVHIIISFQFSRIQHGGCKQKDRR